MTVDASGTGRLAELVGVSLSLSALPENDSDSLICAFRLVAIEFGRDKDATLKPLLEKHSGGTFHTFGSCNGLKDFLWNHFCQPHRCCISGQNGFWMNGLTCLFANPQILILFQKQSIDCQLSLPNCRVLMAFTHSGGVGCRNINPFVPNACGGVMAFVGVQVKLF